MAFFLPVLCGTIHPVGSHQPGKDSDYMKDLSRFMVTPNPVPLNASITVQFPLVSTPAETYHITDDNGQLIRRGRIQDRDRELSLSTGGMQDGVYWLVVGDYRERFTIV